MEMESILKIVGVLVVAIPTLREIYKIWKDSRDYKKMAQIAIDFIEHKFANQDPEVTHAEKKSLQAMQESVGIAAKTDRELDEVRAMRLKSAQDPKNSLELGGDIDPVNGQWKLGAKYRRSF